MLRLEKMKELGVMVHIGLVYLVELRFRLYI